jgi:hypothetical protein
MRTQLVSRLLAAAPGIDTLTSLNAIDPFDLPAAARIDYLSALERQISWLQAMMQRAIVAEHLLITYPMFVQPWRWAKFHLRTQRLLLAKVLRRFEMEWVQRISTQ